VPPVAFVLLFTTNESFPQTEAKAVISPAVTAESTNSLMMFEISFGHFPVEVTILLK
jgi:hypothetical protein